MATKSTLILGASDNPRRYSYTAIQQLISYGHDVIAIGIKNGYVNEVEIITNKPVIEKLHTVSIYLNPTHQKEYYDYIISLKPERLIFNPGAENGELLELAAKNGINCMNACTLVMLATSQY